MSARAKKKEKIKEDLEIGGTRLTQGALQHTVLTFISEKKFDEAIMSLKDYQTKKQYYPSYAKRTSRIFTHADELIKAIRGLKTLPNFQTLSPNKQEELTNRAKEHWEELKVCLRRIKTIEKDLELEDARSTVWVLKALVVATLFVFAAFVAHEAILSMGMPTHVLFDDIVKLLWSYIL